MAVIPRRAILRDVEYVREGITGSDWALRDRIDTIKPASVPLSQSMPMYCCAITSRENRGQLILDCDLHLVAPAGSKSRTWVHTIERLPPHNFDSIRTESGLLYLEVVLAYYALGTVRLVIRVYVVRFVIRPTEPAGSVLVGVA